MRRIALALTVALAVALGAAPADAKAPRARVVTYALTQAEGTVRVAFHGDEAAGCRERGVCTLSGTSTYSFGGKPRSGLVVWAKARKRTIAFHGFFETKGATVSDVVSEGADEHCVDRAEQEYESLAFEPRSRRVRFDWRDLPEEVEGGVVLIGELDDPFDTRCAGPETGDMLSSHALPFADVPYRVFRSPRSTFQTTGTRAFAGGGFAGTVEWDLRYGLRRGGGSGFFAFGF